MPQSGPKLLRWVNKDGLVFVARRVDDTSMSWQMPQGGIDPGENPWVAAQRELREETGVTSARVVATMDRWLTYEFPTNVRQKLTGSWQRYRGQTQKWFLMYFFGEDSEVVLDGHEREFVEWRWAALEQVPAEVVEFKRGVYEEVAAEFAPIIQRHVGAMEHCWWGSSAR